MCYGSSFSFGFSLPLLRLSDEVEKRDVRPRRVTHEIHIRLAIEPKDTQVAGYPPHRLGKVVYLERGEGGGGMLGAFSFGKREKTMANQKSAGTFFFLSLRDAVPCKEQLIRGGRRQLE